MFRVQTLIDALTSRLNLGDRFASMRFGPLGSRFANLRPLSDFFDFKRIFKPASFAEARARISFNSGYFSSNYAVVFVMLSLYSIFNNKALLFDIVLVTLSMFLIGTLDGRDLEIGSQRLTTKQLYTAMCIIAVPVALYASPVGTMFWLVGASGVTILGHAVLMDKPIRMTLSGETV
ncbi:PRA1 family protein-domain-containing protein [Lasiosphaeria miniovina]|uniref:PRA1 family protein n=1 Tax=Lasiosphaeria miniovina TaxID=1954250 RepID=A0AA39ZT08_9PEZI|nr:PRA1 family protein-domain-containing protein [Lasiosphaeria miniovina]KAK0703156.1 PRA1 family protein-domain-containing protein [Lasiosphaeria miniovina]